MSASASRTEVAEMEERFFEQITKLKKVRAVRPYGMCKVLPNLYLGSIFDATDPEQMSANKITDIICIHGMCQTKYGDKSYNVLYININDSPGEKISDYFQSAVEFIHSARLQKRAVLVHCLAGVSRSAIIVAAYLVSVTNVNYSLALTYLTKRRPCANPNFGFRMQFYRFATDSLQSVRQVLTERFGKKAIDDQRQLDHAAIIELCDSVTIAELSKRNIDNLETLNGSTPARQSSTDDSLSMNSLISDIKDICYIDE